MDKVFEIASIPNVAQWFFIVLIVLMLSIAGAFSWAYLKGSQASISVSFNGVEIKLPFYGRIIPLSQVMASEARIVDLKEEHALTPSVRTNGIGLPGYRVGWFRLRSRQKALLALSSRGQVVLVPTTEDYVLLVSTNDAAGLLQALRQYSNT